MLFINEDGTYRTHKDFINTLHEQYNMNDSTNKNFVTKYSQLELKESLAEITLLEFGGVATDLGFKFGRGLADGIDPNNLNRIISEKIFKLTGNVADEQQYKMVKTISQIAKSNVDAQPVKTPENIKFLNSLFIIEEVINGLYASRAELMKIIKGEQKQPTTTLRLGTNAYCSLLVTTFTTFSMLISSSLDCEFDDAQKIKSYNFSFKEDADIDEALSGLSIIVETMRKGKFVQFLSALATSENLNESNMYLTKSLRSKVNLTESLMEGNEKLLNENIADVAMAFLTSNMLTDALLLPVYLVRYVIYLTKYAYVSIKNVNDNIKKSLDILKDHNLKSEKFEQYKEDTTTDNNDLTQASKKATEQVEGAIKKDKVELKQAQQSNGNTIVI